jgi:tetratricopeptide (TPR) repeat protein
MELMKRPALVFSLLLLSCHAAIAQLGPAGPTLRELKIPEALPVCLDVDYDFSKNSAAVIENCTEILQNPALSRDDRYLALVRRSAARYSQRAFEASIVDLTAAIRVKPEQVQAWEYRSDVYTSIGKFALARKDIDAALRLKPNDPDLLNASCWNYGAQAQIEPALRDCKKSLAIRPGDIETLDSHAFVNYRAGKYAQALKEYNTILARTPRYPESLYVRGIIKRKMGDLVGGNKDMHAASAINPDIVEYFANFGLTRGN